MSGFSDFKSFQKLRFFLAGVFPGLVRAPIPSTRATAWLDDHPRIRSSWQWLVDSKAGRTFQQINKGFVYGDGKVETLDWTTIPGESVPILRTAILIAGLLCVLIPAAMLVVWPPLPLEPITGAEGDPVAGWSVCVWMVALAAGWGFLMAGTAAANRIAFLPTIPLFVYYSIGGLAGLPRSWWNLFVGVEASLAILYCEARAPRDVTLARLRGIALCIPLGMAAAVAFIASTPVGALFRGRVLQVSAAAGVPLGLLLWWCGTRIAGGRRPIPPLYAVAAMLAALNLSHLITLAVRGGLVVPAGEVMSLMTEFTAYMWPLYYFIGIGVVFKVLRQTKAVHVTAREVIPGPLFVPLGLVALVVGTAITWTEIVLNNPNFPWPSWIATGAERLYQATASLWARPLAGLTMEWLRWVFLIGLLLLLWSAVRRRLDSGVVAAVLFPTLLAWIAIFEYYFEFSGFLRPPRHTAASMLTFAIFLLWLVHRTTLPWTAGDSRWWPRPARVVMYSAGLLFVLLPLHARSALHDARVSNEIFLYLFFGILDLGMPYYLNLYAAKRFRKLPLSTGAMLGIFAAGAALSVPLTVLDKLSVSGWSFSAVMAKTHEQDAALLAGRAPDSPPPFLPVDWIVVRSILTVTALLLIALFVSRRLRSQKLGDAGLPFAIVAAASGLACFSNRTLTLPLMTPTLEMLITPLRISNVVDVSLAALYLSFVIPALILAILFTARPGKLLSSAGVLAAIGVHMAFMLLWPREEAWLRSTGLLATLGAAGAILFVLLVALVRDRLDLVLEKKEDEGAGGARVLPVGELRWIAAVLLAALGALAYYQSRSGVLVTHAVPGAPVAEAFPSLWHMEPNAKEGQAVFLAPSYTEFRPVLFSSIRPSEPGQERKLMQQVAGETAQQLQKYAPARLEPWDEYRKGTLALDFYFEKGAEGMPLYGTTVIAPIAKEQSVVWTMVYSIGDENRRWDLARAVSTLPEF